MLPSLVVLILFPILCCCQNIQQFHDCTTKLYSCGQAVHLIGYPFWGNHRPSYCGIQGFELTCQEDGVTTIQILNTTFRVLRVGQIHNRIHLALNDLWGKEPNACSLRPNESININTFQYTSFSYHRNDSLFLGLYISCPEDEVRSIPIKNRLNCSGDEGGRVSFFEDGVISLGERCASEIIMPISRESFDEFNRSETMSLVGVLKQGFEMEYRVDGGGICSRCQRSGGTCLSNSLNSSAPFCLCPDGVARLPCRNSENTNPSPCRNLGFQRRSRERGSEERCLETLTELFSDENGGLRHSVVFRRKWWEREREIGKKIESLS